MNLTFKIQSLRNWIWWKREFEASNILLRFPVEGFHLIWRINPRISLKTHKKPNFMVTLHFDLSSHPHHKYRFLCDSHESNDINISCYTFFSLWKLSLLFMYSFNEDILYPIFIKIIINKVKSIESIKVEKKIDICTKICSY